MNNNISLNEETPKQFSAQTLAPKLDKEGPNKPKMRQKSGQNENMRSKIISDNKIYHTTYGDFKTVYHPNPSTKMGQIWPTKSKNEPRIGQNEPKRSQHANTR